jgi:hypothetical protein
MKKIRVDVGNKIYREDTETGEWELLVRTCGDVGADKEARFEKVKTKDIPAIETLSLIE